MILKENPLLYKVKTLNPYSLVDAKTVFIDKRRKPIVIYLEIVFGNMPNDGETSPTKRKKKRLEDLTFKNQNRLNILSLYLGALKSFKMVKKKYCYWFNDIN